jgi:uncharacterized membrane-anchored protein YitT (DUF2179 family)
MGYAEHAWNRLRDRAWLANQFKQLAGILLMATGYLVFIIPPYIVPGGVVGLSAAIVRVTGGKLPVGGVTWCINIILYLATLRLFGVRYIAKVLFTSSVLAIFLDVFTPYVNQFIVPELYGANPTALSPNLLLYAVLGGALIGTGMAVVYRYGGATGGSDVAAMALNRLIPKYSFSQYMLLVDGVIIVIMVVIVGNWNLALYAIAVKFIISRVMDGWLSGVSSAKGVQIITEKPEAIAGRILKEIGRGVTATPCTGMYTHHARTMLFCVVKREQLQKVKALVRQEDPDAFVVLSDLKEVMGKGFGQ